MDAERLKNRKYDENKPTGKMIFLEKKSDFEDLTLDEEDAGDDVDEVDYSLRRQTEQAVDGVTYDSDGEEEFKIDHSVFQNEVIDEDVDFD